MINPCAHAPKLGARKSCKEEPLTTVSLVAVMSGLPAGYCWEGATRWLISWQRFGPKRVSSAHH